MRMFFFATGFMLLIISSSVGQKKSFSYDQLFKGVNSNFSKQLPTIKGWADDEHYLEIRKDDSGKLKLMSVEVKSGKAALYPDRTNENKTFSATSLGLSNKERNITPSPNGKWVAYTRDNNLYAMDVSTKKEIQFTHDGSDVILNGYASWVYYEEILGRASHYKAFWWSPDNKSIAFMRFDDSEVPVFPIYVAEGQHGFLENERYPKAGDKNPSVRIGITSLDQPNLIWTDFNEKDDQYFGTPWWTPGGQLWVQWMNRGQDNLKIFSINSADGSKKEIYDEKQSTWIDLDAEDRIEFLNTVNNFVLKSDKDGWENLYLFNLEGKLQYQLTSGNFWGTSIVKIDEKQKVIYFKARKESSARYDLYKVGLNGKGLTRLSFGDYCHDQFFLSPNGKYFITVYSNLSTPTTMALADAKGKIIRELGNAKGNEFDNYIVPKSELVRVKSSDGIFDLPVLITYPVNFDPNKKYPVLISIYGGPNAGTVFDRWPRGGSSQWWAQEGLVQVSFDNRSSGHFGKKGLNFIYRQLGKWEIEDYRTCGIWLRQQSWVDTGKIAMYGGSFGGYMTCMALTYGSDVFTHGVANSSVTDWQFYDTHYTERYMDTPGENPEGYKNTSVMTYVDNYHGLLLIIHGTTDDNVHLQNSIELINKLEDLHMHFELMLYPGQRHGIGGSKALHIRNETYNFFYRNLLNKELPAVFRERNTQRAF